MERFCNARAASEPGAAEPADVGTPVPPHVPLTLYIVTRADLLYNNLQQDVANSRNHHNDPGGSHHVQAFHKNHDT